MDVPGALITFGVGVGGVVLGAALARSNQQRAAKDRLLVEALNDMVGAIAEVAGGAGGEAQWRYASAVSRVALHAPPRVVDALRRFQDDATTATPAGRARLIAVVEAARSDLGHSAIGARDLEVLLFGAHRGPFELAWAEQHANVGRELEASAAIPLMPGGNAPGGLRGAGALANTAPLESIQQAYAEVEAALRRLAETRGITAERADDVAEERLRASGAISPETAHAVRGLRTLRDLTVHAPRNQPTERHAREYLVLAEAVLFAIDANARRAGPPADR